MQHALALAARGEGRTRPNPPVGAVVVRSGRLVGTGYHSRSGGPHAEVKALGKAGVRTRGSTLYVTLEPCSTSGRTPPCTELVCRSGVTRVVAAVRDPNPGHCGRGFRMLRRSGIEVSVGAEAAAARALLAPFATWIATGRPLVTLKMAMTLDGRIADASGRSRWISGTRSRRRVGYLRDRVDAIMVGGNTARRDNPALCCRRTRGIVPYRVIVDTRGALPLSSRVLRDGMAARTIVATTRACPATRQRAYEAAGASVWVLPARQGRVSAAALLRRLGNAGVLHVLCEGGGELARTLAAGDHVDRYVFFVAPRILGGSAVPVIGAPGWRLPAAPRLAFREIERVGEDVLIEAVPVRKNPKQARISNRQ